MYSYKNLKLAVLVLLAIFCVMCSNVFATDLDGIGVVEQPDVVEEQDVGGSSTSNTGSSDTSFDNGEAVGNLFKGVGVDAESVEKASVIIEPVAKGMNKVMAIILGLLSLALLFITLLDLVYIAFPPVRGMLMGQDVSQQQSGMSQMGMGMGMGGYGGYGRGYGGYGGYGGMGGMQQQPQNPVMGFLGRWISDEAVAAAQESQAGAASQAAMGMPMGMGMGMGMNTGNAPQATTKSMVFSYMKKRALFLVLFGVCVILFTSTIFTDLGVKLGMLVLKWLSGIKIG